MRSAQAILVQQHARDRKSALCTYGLLTDEAAHRCSVASLLPQPCFRTPAQQRARPCRIVLEEIVVAIKPSAALGVAEICPLEDFLRHWIVNRCGERRCLINLVLLDQVNRLL